MKISKQPKNNLTEGIAAPTDPTGATLEKTCLRIKHCGDWWTIENRLGERVGNARDCRGALKLARLVAEVEKASVIAILNVDGSLGRTLNV